MLELAIIADDLTGANDTGVQLARRGLKTSVLINLEQTVKSGQLDAAVIDTDSRASVRDEAYRRVRAASEHVLRLGCNVIYKKMDSTLRGNIGAELDAVYDAVQPDFIVIAPAYPQNGRVVKQGVLYVNGKPVHETDAGTDPKTPVKESHIPTLLRLQTNRGIGLIDLNDIGKGSAHVLQQLKSMMERQLRYILFDAAADTDLQLVADCITRSGSNVVWAGSAGLANWLPLPEPVSSAAGEGGGPDDGSAASNAESSGEPDGYTATANAISGSGTKGDAAASNAEVGNGAAGNVAAPHSEVGGGNGAANRRPVLLVVGSVNGQSRKQLDTLLRSRVSIKAVTLQSYAAVEDGPARSAELARLCAEAEQALSGGMDTVLFSTGGKADIEQANEAGRSAGLDSTAVSGRIADALGEAAAYLMDRCPLQGIVMTGGDTAKQVCLHWGASRFDLLDEVESGIPRGRLIGAKTSIYAVTKAGGFGSETVLLRAVERLRGEDEANG